MGLSKSARILASPTNRLKISNRASRCKFKSTAAPAAALNEADLTKLLMTDAAFSASNAPPLIYNDLAAQFSIR